MLLASPPRGTTVPRLLVGGQALVLASPYARARDTARLVMEETGLAPGVDALLRLDERLREEEFGTPRPPDPARDRPRHPELNAQRQHVGKFYFRPPGGESWCDVILRLRSLLEMITREHGGVRVLVSRSTFARSTWPMHAGPFSRSAPTRWRWPGPVRPGSAPRWCCGG